MTIMYRFLPLALALLLTACAQYQEEEAVVPVEPEPVSEEFGRENLDCEPGTDDGIGGTGCSVD